MQWAEHAKHHDISKWYNAGTIQLMAEGSDALNVGHMWARLHLDCGNVMHASPISSTTQAAQITESRTENVSYAYSVFLKGTAGLIVIMGIKSSERARSYGSLGIGQPISFSFGHISRSTLVVYTTHICLVQAAIRVELIGPTK